MVPEYIKNRCLDIGRRVLLSAAIQVYPDQNKVACNQLESLSDIELDKLKALIFSALKFAVEHNPAAPEDALHLLRNLQEENTKLKEELEAARSGPEYHVGRAAILLHNAFKDVQKP